MWHLNKQQAYKNMYVNVFFGNRQYSKCTYTYVLNAVISLVKPCGIHAHCLSEIECDETVILRVTAQQTNYIVAAVRARKNNALV